MIRKYIACIIMLIVVSNVSIYAESIKHKTPKNAYECNLYYNNKKIDSAYTYDNTCYVPIRALAEEMGYMVTYEPDKYIENTQYRMYGTIKISNDTDNVTICGTKGGYKVYKNEENVTYTSNFKIINKAIVTANIEHYLKVGYLTSDEYDLNNYLKEDTTYIGLRSISELFGCTVEYDKDTGNIYVNDYGNDKSD